MQGWCNDNNANPHAMSDAQTVAYAAYVCLEATRELADGKVVPISYDTAKGHIIGLNDHRKGLIASNPAHAAECSPPSALPEVKDFLAIKQAE